MLNAGAGRKTEGWARAAALALIALLGLPAEGLGQQIRQASSDPLQTLTQWNRDYRRRGEGLDPQADAPVLPALESMRRRFWLVDPAENEALVLLCDLASIGERGSESAIARGTYVAEPREGRVREAALSVLDSALDASSGQGRGQWLALNVLGQPEQHALPRRIAVAQALQGRHWEPTLLPLLDGAAAPQRGLREVCVAALSGWRSEAVSRYLAKLTVRALREPDFLSTEALVAHFSAQRLPAEDPATIEIAQVLSASVISTNWREAIRRIPFSRTLPDDVSLPQLIEALSIWTNRGLAGGASRRVEAALVEELELRSGKRLGFAPERWAFWWKATRGTLPANGAGEGGQAEAQTRATFFGLRPWTDRVIFVIDRSGSMADDFGTGAGSRYEEAVRQLGVFLEQLGPRTRFGVILFSDQPRRFGSELRQATPGGISAALAWARQLGPQGGTQLRPAIEMAMELHPRSGQPDLERLEADTLIVLCDGATAEGAGWVKPLFQAVGKEACLRIDCVQIGSGGNGTLEALAEESGGQFVRVDS